jgi:hypothetical protein
MIRISQNSKRAAESFSSTTGGQIPDQLPKTQSAITKQ